jgi:hypothetical protein
MPRPAIVGGVIAMLIADLPRLRAYVNYGEPRRWLLVGELDAANAPGLADALLPQVLVEGDLLLDLTGVTRIGPESVEVLEGLAQRLQNGRLVVHCLDGPPMHVLAGDHPGIEVVSGDLGAV